MSRWRCSTRWPGTTSWLPVMAAVADGDVSVVLSSHVLAELERVADYLVLITSGSVQVAGEVDDLLASHRVLTGSAAEADSYAQRLDVVNARAAGRRPTCWSGPTGGPARYHMAGRSIPSAWRSWPWPTCVSLAPGRSPVPKRARGAEPMEVTNWQR